MSYILDALRRADSERDRGAIPGIHAQPVPPHWRDARGKRRMPPWVGAMIGLSVVVLGAFGWHLVGRETAPVVAPSPAPALPPLSGAPPAPATAAAPVAAAPTPATPSSPAAVATPPVPPAVAAAPPPAAKNVERQRVPASPPAEQPRRKPATQVATAPATVTEPGVPLKSSKSEPAVAPPATAESRVYSPNDLPADIRRQLPQLAIGGSMYSENASSRMLIVNGQLVHEGAKLGPDLSLEQIKLRSAVLKFKGYRYEISY